MAAKIGTFNTSNLTECSICIETYKKPKCLPCIHTFCLECLKTYGEDSQPGDDMSCPICRQTFKVPHKGLDKLPNNFFIQQMLDSKSQLSGAESNELKCEVCTQNDASKYCVECAQNMCDACSIPHGKLRSTKLHKVASLNEMLGSQVYLRPTYCDIHKADQLRLYCHDCKLAICLMCSAIKHESHHREDLQESSRSFTEQLRAGYPKLSDCIEDKKRKLTLLDDSNKCLLKQISVCEQQIIKRAAEIKSLVDAQCSQLLSQLESHKIKRLKEIQTQIVETDTQKMVLESFKTYTAELIDKGSACLISQCSLELLARGEQLVAATSAFDECSLNKPRATFEAANSRDVIGDCTQLIGSIQFKVCAAENFLMAIGLSTESGMLQHVCHISLKRPGSVTTIDSTPTWIGPDAAACMIGNPLYAVGIGPANNELWKWSEASDWTRGEDMTSGRRKHCVAVVGSTLYALGGFVYATETTLNSIVAYNTQTNKWSAAGQLTHAVRGAPCVSYKNLIYVFGGIDKENQYVAHVQIYNPADESCSLMRSPMPKAERQMRAVLWETSAILIGHLTCFIYSFESHEWQERVAFKAETEYFGLVIDNDTLFMAGGGLSTHNKDRKQIWTCTNEVKSVSVHDVMDDKQGVVWKHHTKLPRPAKIQAYSLISLLQVHDK